MIQPLQVIAEDGMGGFSLFACMIFKDSLFRTTVQVDAQGTVILMDEELLVEDMPVRDDTFAG